MRPDALTYLDRPAAAAPEGMLVLLHGRGADEGDLYPLFDVLDPDRRLYGVTPRGPLRLPPGGAHWYAVREIGFPDPVTFFATLERTSRWLDAFADVTGIPPGRTVLGGFSQGAVMTYALALGEGRARPAGLFALSGFVPRVPGFRLDLSPPLPPVAIGHGKLDPVIGVEWGRDARSTFVDAGADPLYREAPKLGHAVDPVLLRRLRPWIRRALAGAGA